MHNLPRCVCLQTTADWRGDKRRGGENEPSTQRFIAADNIRMHAHMDAARKWINTYINFKIQHIWNSNAVVSLFSLFFLRYVSFLWRRYKSRGEIRGVGENKCCMESEIMYLVCVFPSCLNQARGGRAALGLLLVTVSVFLDFSPPPFSFSFSFFSDSPELRSGVERGVGFWRRVN